MIKISFHYPKIPPQFIFTPIIVEAILLQQRHLWGMGGGSIFYIWKRYFYNSKSFFTPQHPNIHYIQANYTYIYLFYYNNCWGLYIILGGFIHILGGFIHILGGFEYKCGGFYIQMWGIYNTKGFRVYEYNISIR